jgi:hypothetical protein
MLSTFLIAENIEKNGSGNIITSVPREMTYQGILKDSGGDPVADSVYSVTFRIFNVESGGTSLWNGLFNATFSNVDLPFDEDYWLELEIDSEILDPRQKMSMVGYAAVSDTADYAWDADKVDNYSAFALLNRPNHTGIQPPSTISPQGNGSGLNADMVDNYHAGNSSGNVPISNGALNVNLHADIWDTHNWGDLYPNADQLDGQHASYFTPLSQFNSHSSNSSAHHSPVTSVDGLSGGTITSSTTVNGTSYADKFYIFDAGNHNAVNVRNNSPSSSAYPAGWFVNNSGDGGTTIYAENTSDSYHTIKAVNNYTGSSSYLMGVYADMGSNDHWGICTNATR